MSRFAPVATALIAVSVALVASGCGNEAPPVETPVASAPAEPTPTPTEAAPPFEPTCENIVTQGSLDEFASEGVSITPQAEFIAKMADEGQTKWVTLDSAGGAVCQTGNEINAFEIYGYAVLTGDQSNEVSATLYDEGFEVDTSGGTAGQWFAIPADTEGIDRSWYFDAGDGTVAFGASKERVEEILAIVRP